MDEDQTLASSNEAPIEQPPRRSRLRLLLLLTLLVVLGGALGGWHVYSVYLARHVEAAEPAVAGKLIVIRGRYAEFLGFDNEAVALDVNRIHPDGKRTPYKSATGRANRHGLWSYDFEVTLDKFTHSGEYEIEVLPLTRAIHARKGKHTDVDLIRGKMVVSAPK